MTRLRSDQRHVVGFTLNGVATQGEAEPRMLLTDFLRHRIGATGTHVGCEHGVCGACTVTVDGMLTRACLTLAVQIDGCDHRWLEDRAPACTALVYVDDATSRLMVILFVGAESTFAYFEATHRYLERYGKPLAFYSDKASVFRVNKQSAAAGKGHTQFGRALFELNIDGMCAERDRLKKLAGPTKGKVLGGRSWHV